MSDNAGSHPATPDPTPEHTQPAHVDPQQVSAPVSASSAPPDGLAPPAGYAPPQAHTPPPGYVAPQAYTAPQGHTAPQAYTAPQGYVEPQGYTAPQGHTAPQAYAAPQGYAPPQGYTAPQGYAPPPGYAHGPYTPPAAPAQPRRGSGLGVVAFVLALAAAIVGTALGSIAAFNIGLGTAAQFALDALDIEFDWSALTPVREWVLLAEAAFWGGTVLGVWAIVQGIVAIAKNRGRGWAVAAVVIAVIGPIAFVTGVQLLLTAGIASGASIGG